MMEINAQDLIDAVTTQRNNALNECAMLAAQVKHLQDKLAAKDEQIANDAKTKLQPD